MGNLKRIKDRKQQQQKPKKGIYTYLNLYIERENVKKNRKKVTLKPRYASEKYHL